MPWNTLCQIKMKILGSAAGDRFFISACYIYIYYIFYSSSKGSVSKTKLRKRAACSMFRRDVGQEVGSF